MANALYPKFKQFLLAILSTGTVKAQLVDAAAYTYNAAHEFLSDIPSGARIGTAVTLTTKTVTDGVFDADNVSVTGLTSAPTIEALALYIDTGVEGTSRLVAYIDTATGLPVSAGATQVDATWDNGANKIFRL